MANNELIKRLELPGRGRALVTTRRVRAGEIVLKDSPSLLYVVSTASDRFCGTCLRMCSGPDCTDFGAVRFCSAECSASFPKDLCSALGELKKAEFVSEEENQARFLLAAYHLQLVSSEEFEKLLVLEGEGTVDDEGVSKLHSFVEKAVQSWPWKADRKLSPRLTADLLVKEARNGFGLMAPNEKPGERAVRGYGLYTTAAFINHECLPNCCRFEYVDKAGKSNTDIYIRAMHDLEPETEISISYFPINWPYELRQERLEKEYGFKCTCERCDTEQAWSDVENGGEEGLEEEETQDEASLEKVVQELNLKASTLESARNGEEEKNIEAEEDEEQDGEEDVEIDGDFEHAMFFVKYLCPVEDCGGTMAPIPQQPDTNLHERSDDDEDADLFLTMECNMCGHVRTGDEFRKDLEENRILE
ncbi:hypothetical protein R1sor_024956 [Riccia sorocarpa]|uniref:SET domain-containing protein n=1 Tax=Riccia sorocarpa TaxID=122646 RepID=A0ABD3G7Q4_9MARC